MAVINHISRIGLGCGAGVRALTAPHLPLTPIRGCWLRKASGLSRATSTSPPVSGGWGGGGATGGSGDV